MTRNRVLIGMLLATLPVMLGWSNPPIDNAEAARRAAKAKPITEQNPRESLPTLHALIQELGHDLEQKRILLAEKTAAFDQKFQPSPQDSTAIERDSDYSKAKKALEDAETELKKAAPGTTSTGDVAAAAVEKRDFAKLAFESIRAELLLRRQADTLRSARRDLAEARQQIDKLRQLTLKAEQAARKKS